MVPVTTYEIKGKRLMRPPIFKRPRIGLLVLGILISEVTIALEAVAAKVPRAARDHGNSVRMLK